MSEKPLFDKYFREKQYEGSECTFTNLFIWRKCYKIQWAVIDDFLCIKAGRDDEEFVLPPFGDYTDGNKVVDVIDKLISYFHEQKKPFKMKGVYSNIVSFLEELKPDCFSFTTDRDNFDYVYNASDLIELKGRKFHAKKNHVNSFRNAYPNYEYLPLTPELVSECMDFEVEWCEQRGCDEDPSLKCEKCAVTEALNNFEVLGFQGGVIKINNKVEAFTFGETLNSEMAVIHVEKANPDIKGLYAVINQDFCKNAWSEMKYINREEDMGLEGLRKAKESYRPVKYVEKYTAILK